MMHRLVPLCGAWIVLTHAPLLEGAKVETVKGTVTILRGANTFDAREGMTVENADQIQTAGNSKAEVSLGKNLTLSVGVDSLVQVKERNIEVSHGFGALKLKHLQGTDNVWTLGFEKSEVSMKGGDEYQTPATFHVFWDTSSKRFCSKEGVVKISSRHPDKTVKPLNLRMHDCSGTEAEQTRIGFRFRIFTWIESKIKSVFKSIYI